MFSNDKLRAQYTAWPAIATHLHLADLQRDRTIILGPDERPAQMMQPGCAIAVTRLLCDRYSSRLFS
jgi:hypothetical protein